MEKYYIHKCKYLNKTSMLYTLYIETYKALNHALTEINIFVFLISVFQSPGQVQ